MKNKLVKFLAYEGKILVTCINSTKIVEDARITHDLSPVVTAAFGRLLTMSAMMGADLKHEKDKLTLQIKGNGPIKDMLVTTNHKAEVKGYVANPVVDIPLNEFGKLDVGGAVGAGFLNVIKDIGLKKPYIGVLPLITGEIGDDFAEYFSKSEQKNTAVALGVLVDKNGVKAAGGYMITAMPDASTEEISNIEQAIFRAGAISKMLDNDLSLEEIAKCITLDENIKKIEEIEPNYKCDCSKDKMSKALITLNKTDLQEMIDEGSAEIQCYFCNIKYEFNKSEIANLQK